MRWMGKRREVARKKDDEEGPEYLLSVYDVAAGESPVAGGCGSQGK